MNIKKLRAAMKKMVAGPYTYCKEYTGRPCQCGLVWDVTGNVAVIDVMGPNDEASDIRPTKKQQELNTIGFVMMLNAMPELLDELEALRQDKLVRDFNAKNKTKISSHKEGSWQR